MGSMIEFPIFYDYMTEEENLKLHCEYMGYYSNDNIKDTLNMLGLVDAAGKLAKNDSLGMKEGLGIARAILFGPELLILDEPTNRLDPAWWQANRSRRNRKLLIYGVLLLTAGYTHISTAGIPMDTMSFWPDLVLGSIAMRSISYIALLVGMRMKSSKATIVTSVIVVILTQGNIGDFTLSNNILFYAVLMVLSVMSVYLMLYNAEAKDLI